MRRVRIACGLALGKQHVPGKGGVARAGVKAALAVSAQIDDGRDLERRDCREVVRRRIAVLARSEQPPAHDPRAIACGIAAIIAEIVDAFERQDAIGHVGLSKEAGKAA